MTSALPIIVLNRFNRWNDQKEKIMPVTIYHNPRCSKSRATLELLEEKGVELNVVKYLDQPPSEAELRLVLEKLGIGPRDLMRSGESVYAEKGLGNLELSDDDLIAAMLADPVLIERPVVVNGNKAAIGRPPSQVLEIV